MEIYKPTDDLTVISSYEPAPGLGLLPINAFVITGQQPVLIDSGMEKEAGSFMPALRSVIDPVELRWIVLTHDEGDHLGAFQELIDVAPNARLAMNWVALAKLGARFDVPLDRLYLVNHGQSIDIGDRKLVTMRPPVFDNPATLALFDDKNRAYFSADAFGALVQQPANDLTDVDEKEFAQGFYIFNSANHPWVHNTDVNKFGEKLASIRALDASLVLGSHLPAASGQTERLLAQMAEMPASPEFVGPDQAALAQMLAQMAAGGAH